MSYSSLAQYLQKKDRMTECRVEQYFDLIEIKTENLVWRTRIVAWI
jgi:hypothetical protein